MDINASDNKKKFYFQLEIDYMSGSMGKEG